MDFAEGQPAKIKIRNSSSVHIWSSNQHSEREEQEKRKIEKKESSAVRGGALTFSRS